MNLLRRLVRWGLGDVEGQVFLCEMEELYRHKAEVEGRAAAGRWRRRELRRAAFHALASRLRRSPRPAGSQLATVWRDVRFGFRPEGAIMDVRLAARSLMRTPGFTLAAVVILALGIGANTTVFCALKAAVLTPPPFRDVDRLVVVELKRVHDGAEIGNGEGPSWPTPAFEVLRASADGIIDPVANYKANRVTLTGHGLATEIEAEIVAPAYFSVLGMHAQLGRTFLPTEEDPAIPARVAILSYAFWLSRFGGEASAVGQELVLMGRPYEVVGVAPPGFRGLTGRAQLWVPTGAVGDFIRLSDLERVTNRVWWVVGRLRPGVRLGEAQAQMHIIGQRIDTNYPFGSSADLHYAGGARSLQEVWQNPRARTSVLLLTASAILVLLVACADLSGLLIARYQRKSRDSGVRLALGASRWRLVRAWLAECLVLSGVGGAAGLLVAHVGAGLLRGAWPRQLLDNPDGGLRVVNLDTLRVDAAVLGYALATVVVVATLGGLLPALRASGVDPAENLKAGSGGTRRRARILGLDISHCLLASQVAMALLLLICAALMGASVRRLLDVPHGFGTENRLTFEYLTPREWPADARASFEHQMMERIAALPGVVGVARGGCIPANDVCSVSSAEVVEGQAEAMAVNDVHGPYFDVLGIPIVAGRALDQRDGHEGPATAVLDETAARVFFPGTDPVGRWIRIGDSRFQIVGVAARVLHGIPDHVPMPEAYVSNWILRPGYSVIVRTSVQPRSLTTAIRRSIDALSPEVVPARIATMDEIVARTTGDRRIILALLTTFSLVTMLLVAIGTWAIVARTVVDHRREFGLRIAFGALNRQVMLPVLRQSMTVATLGLGIGLALAWATTFVLESLLYGTTPRDPATFILGTVLLLGVVGVATYLPARRATKIDPMEVLRSD